MHDNDLITESEKSHQLISYEAACESIVLLKNDGLLPLSNIKNIAVYGSGVELTPNGGTGSGEVHSRYNISIKDGLEKNGFSITTKKWLDDYKKDYQLAIKKGNKTILKKLLHLTPSNMINIIEGNVKLPSGRLITLNDVKESDTDTCIYVISRQSGEAKDRELDDYNLTDIEKENITFCLNNYKKAIIVINCGSSIDMSWLLSQDKINAIIYYGQPGMEGGNALASILKGKVSPSAKLTDTWYKSYNDIPYSNEYGKLGKDENNANYKENIYVGYRYTDSFNKDVAFSFGHGLSYTNFNVEFIDIKNNNSHIELSVEVQNTGKLYSAKETIQVYLQFPNLKIEREKHCLVSFAKTKLLKPQEKQKLTLSFKLEDFAYYNSKDAYYLLEKGNYIIKLGNSSSSLNEIAYICLKDDVITEKCINICPTNNSFELLSNSDKKGNYTNIDNLPCITLEKNCFNTKINKYEYIINATSYAKDKIKELTLDNKLNLLIGSGVLGSNIVPGAFSSSIKLLDKGIPNLILSDGPSGLRIHKRVGYNKKNKIVLLEENFPFLQGLPKLLKKIIFTSPKKVKFKYQNITAFASPSTLAQSFNIELMENVGKAVGEEMKEYGITHLLGPAINIHKNPLCGRNFEYFSEDPLLTGILAAHFSIGLQSNKGCFVTLKHFAANNQETKRTTMSSNVDERTLREIYLKAFKIIIDKVKIKSIMTSYNKINDTYTCNSKDLCINVLRCEFGFDGMVMSDWLSTSKGLASNGLAIASGNDLIMPGGKKYLRYLKNDYKKGIFTTEQLDKAVINILNQICLIKDN